MIYDFFDYRSYLSWYCDFSYEQDCSFSHRTFLDRCGIKGSAYLSKVLNGSKKVRSSHVPSLLQGLQLNSEESRYFEHMVAYTNMREKEEAVIHLREMLSIRSRIDKYKLNDTRYSYYRRWYYPVIRELAQILNFQDDFNFLARMVIPAITGPQAEGAVKFLLANGFLEKKDDGRYEQCDPIVSTGEDFVSTIVRAYHQTTLQESAKDLYRVSPEEREVGSLVLSVSERNYQRIREKMREFRKEILAIATEDQECEKVCHVGLQLFPKSKTEKEDSK